MASCLGGLFRWSKAGALSGEALCEEIQNECIRFVKGRKAWQHASHASCNDAPLRGFSGRHHLLTLGTTFLYGAEHGFWQDPGSWILFSVGSFTNKLSFSQPIQGPACNMTTILLGKQLPGWHFTPWHYLSAVSSQTRTDFCPVFHPWRLSLWCLYLWACPLDLHISHLRTFSIHFNC